MASRVRRRNPGLEEDAVILGVGVVVVIVAANVLSSGAVNRAVGQAGYNAAVSAGRAVADPSIQLPGLPKLPPGFVAAGLANPAVMAVAPAAIGVGIAAQQAPSVWNWISNIPTSIRDWATGLSGSTPTPRTGLEAGTRDSGYTDSSGQRWKQGYQ